MKEAIVLGICLVTFLLWPEVWMRPQEWSLMSLVGVLAIFHWITKKD